MRQIEAFSFTATIFNLLFITYYSLFNLFAEPPLKWLYLHTLYNRVVIHILPWLHLVSLVPCSSITEPPLQTWNDIDTIIKMDNEYVMAGLAPLPNHPQTPSRTLTAGMCPGLEVGREYVWIVDKTIHPIPIRFCCICPGWEVVNSFQIYAILHKLSWQQGMFLFDRLWGCLPDHERGPGPATISGDHQLLRAAVTESLSVHKWI